MLLFTASDFTSITIHIHSWVVFLLWLCLFILSVFISPGKIGQPFCVIPVCGTLSGLCHLLGNSGTAGDRPFSHGQRSLEGYSS